MPPLLGKLDGKPYQDRLLRHADLTALEMTADFSDGHPLCLQLSQLFDCRLGPGPGIAHFKIVHCSMQLICRSFHDRQWMPRGWRRSSDFLVRDGSTVHRNREKWNQSCYRSAPAGVPRLIWSEHRSRRAIPRKGSTMATHRLTRMGLLRKKLGILPKGASAAGKPAAAKYSGPKRPDRKLTTAT